VELPTARVVDAHRVRKACMGWSWAAACGVQARGHIVRPRVQLVVSASV